MSNNKIFYIGNFELPDKSAAAHRVVNNAKALRDLGYDVVLVGTNKTSKSLVKETFFDFTSYQTPYPINTVEWVKSLLNINTYIKIIDKEQSCHSIILYNMPSMAIYNFMKIAKKRNVKIYSDCTEWSDNNINGNFGKSLIKILDSKIRMHYLNRKFDGIISISKFLHDNYTSVCEKYSILIPPLVDVLDSKWIVGDSELSSLSIVYAGGAFSIKDNYVKDRLDLVVVAFALMKKRGYQFTFKVIGCSKEDFLIFYPQYTSQIEELNSSIVFLNKINHLDAIEIIKKSSFSIFLRDENIVTQAGFPTKFVESITAGTPVLTNDNSNVKDFLEHGKNGYLINTKDTESIIASLIPAFDLSNAQVMYMKKYTYDSKLFDYRNYIKKFKFFTKNG